MIAKPYISELPIAASVSKRVYANPFQPKLILWLVSHMTRFQMETSSNMHKNNAFLLWLKSFITTNTTQTMEIN